MNPRQEVLRSFDVYGLLAEVLGPGPHVLIDGGANDGATTRRLGRAFPGSVIHAFEPVGEVFGALEVAAASVGATPHRLALGECDTSMSIRVNRNLWTSSFLAASERGGAYHGDWCETVRREDVRVVRLDTWAAGAGIDRIGLLKLDLQGYEMPALRGASGVLERVDAVYSEAQLIPEYEGASTFAEIDLFLRDRGFGLYQVADLCLKGAHAEPSCCDGLWLRAALLDEVRARATPSALGVSAVSRSARMAEALRLCAESGLRRVALYGAGAHTIAAAPALADPPVDVIGIIDDDPHRAGALWGFPVMSLRSALSARVDAIVLSSDRGEASMLERLSGTSTGGVRIVSLYARGGAHVHGVRASTGSEGSVGTCARFL